MALTLLNKHNYIISWGLVILVYPKIKCFCMLCLHLSWLSFSENSLWKFTLKFWWCNLKSHWLLQGHKCTKHFRFCLNINSHSTRFTQKVWQGSTCTYVRVNFSPEKKNCHSLNPLYVYRIKIISSLQNAKIITYFKNVGLVDIYQLHH